MERKGELAYIFGDFGRSWINFKIWGAKENTFRELRNFLSGIWEDRCIIFRDQGSTDPPGSLMTKNCCQDPSRKPQVAEGSLWNTGMDPHKRGSYGPQWNTLMTKQMLTGPLPPSRNFLAPLMQNLTCCHLTLIMGMQKSGICGLHISPCMRFYSISRTRR